MQVYKPPFFLFNGHIATIYPAFFRDILTFDFYNEKIITPDDDFLELDWIKRGNSKLAIISHGLEGNSRRHYMLGMAAAFAADGYDVLLWNYRSCGPEMNKALRFYHSGATDDLQTVIQHTIKQGYAKISLIGFSLGGNLTLKYLGENQANLPAQIKNAVVFSVPCDLLAGVHRLNRWYNKPYSARFLNSLKWKVIQKSRNHILLKEKLPFLKNTKTLMAFDDLITAPLHGFADAADYYHQCSAIHFIEAIRVPVLIVNALNDPFLPKECYPVQEAENNQHVTLEMPAKGGHCGFRSKGGVYWSEVRAVGFCGGK